MSLKEAFPSEIPAETAQIVEPLLPVDNVYRLIGEYVDNFLSDADFKEWYAIEGRPGINPIILSMVTIFQFLVLGFPGALFPIYPTASSFSTESNSTAGQSKSQQLTAKLDRVQLMWIYFIATC